MTALTLARIPFLHDATLVETHDLSFHLAQVPACAACRAPPPVKVPFDLIGPLDIRRLFALAHDSVAELGFAATDACDDIGATDETIWCTCRFLCIPL